MAAEIVFQVLAAGRRVTEMVKNAKECEIQAKDISCRMEATLVVVENAAKRLNDSNKGACHSLRELKKLIETVEDLVKRSLSSRSSSSFKRGTKKLEIFFFSDQRLADINRAAAKLSSIQQDLILAMVADQVPSDEVLLALKIGQMAGSSNALKLIKRRMEGRVVFEELEEVDNDILGKGSFGQVTAGYYYGKPVAIKKTLENTHLGREERAVFREEANTHFLLQHDRVVRVFAFTVGEGSHPPCLIMERMDGTLYELLERGDFPLETRLEYMIDICEGLNFLSQHRVVHRDIKSHNILLQAGQAKVSDFGLARVCSTIGTKTGNASFIEEKSGTFFWMAPEVLESRRGHLDSDIFSLHVVMWEIMENTKGGTGLPIGERLLRDELAKLPLTERGEPFEARIHTLVRNCGLKDRQARPKIDEVLAEAKRIYDSVVSGSAAGPDAVADITNDLEHVLSLGGEDTPPPSESRRRTQKQQASEDQSAPRSWKDDGRDLVAAAAEGDNNQGGRQARAREAMEGWSSSAEELSLRAQNVHLSFNGDKTRTATISIYNATGSPLTYHLHHDIHGTPERDFPRMVENARGEVALHRRWANALYGSEGYVVYTAQNGDGNAFDVLLCFMTSYQRIRAVYVEVQEKGHWDNKQHLVAVTTKLNENRVKSHSLSKHGLTVVGVVAHDSPRPCQFIVGLEGSVMPAPWA